MSITTVTSVVNRTDGRAAAHLWVSVCTQARVDAWVCGCVGVCLSGTWTWSLVGPADQKDGRGPVHLGCTRQTCVWVCVWVCVFEGRKRA